jgi:hypothetical protein
MKRETLERAKRAEEDARRSVEEREREAKKEEVRLAHLGYFMTRRFAEVEEILALGVVPYIYEVIAIDATSNMNGNTVGAIPDLTELTTFGWQGWELVGVVPSTYGEGLQNVSYGASSGNTWGAGIGGLVIGAYLLLRMPVTRQMLDTKRDWIQTRFEKEFKG